MTVQRFGFMVVTLAALFVPSASTVPPDKGRSLKDDQNLLAQKPKSAMQWQAKPVQVVRNGKQVTVIPALGLSREIVITHKFKGDEAFLKKGEFKGNISFGLPDDKGGAFTNAVYRLEEKGKQRFIVVPDFKGGEIALAYELDGDVLKIKTGAKFEVSGAGVGPLTIHSGEYKRVESP